MKRWIVLALVFCATASAQGPPDPGVGRSVNRALAYLARQQQADGSITSFEETAPRGRSTAVAVLAMLAAGYTPADGRHALALHNALGYLLRTAPGDGYFGYGDDSGMAGQDWITLALAESYGAEADANQKAQLGPLLNNALAAILALQDNRAAPDAGGWNEAGQPGSNLPVTALTVLALKSLAGAGLAVPDDALRRAAAFARSCARPKGAGFAEHGQTPTALSTASGACILLLTHAAKADELKPALKALGAMKPGEAEDDHATAFLAALAGGDAGVAQALRKRQAEDGAWLAAHPDSPGASAVSTTAVGVLTLTVPYRWLPVYATP